MSRVIGAPRMRVSGRQRAESPQRAEVDHVPVDAVPLALGGFQVHWYLAEAAVMEQVAEGGQAQPAVADVLVAVEARAQRVPAVV